MKACNEEPGIVPSDCNLHNKCIDDIDNHLSSNTVKYCWEHEGVRRWQVEFSSAIHD